MKIVIFGASGVIGSVIVDEALERGHEVTAAVRSPEKVKTNHPRLNVVQALIDNEASVENAVSGHDAVINSVGGLGHENTRISIECMEPLTSALRSAGVKRLLVVGTAGTLEVEPGLMRKDQPDFPDFLKKEAQAQVEVQQFLKALGPDELQWTYFSPPALIEGGERTGKVTLGTDQLLYNSDGESYISNEDFAMATIDELERPEHIAGRFTAVTA